MKFLFLFLVLSTSFALAQTKQDGGGALPGGFIDPGTGFGFFTSPPLMGTAKTLDLSGLANIQSSRGQCSFTVNTSQSANEARNALEQVISQCRTDQPGMPSSASGSFDPLVAISRAFGDAATDPQSCFNYERTYDNLFKRIMENPEVASGQMRSCTRDTGEEYVAV